MALGAEKALGDFALPRYVKVAALAASALEALVLSFSVVASVFAVL